MKRYITLLALGMALTAMAYGPSFGNAQLFNDGWRFSLNDDSLARNEVYADQSRWAGFQPAHTTARIDTNWRQLTLPHDWSVEHPLSPDKASCQGYLPGGIGWYRKTFEVDSKADSVWNIYFEGVYNRSDVYINGHHLGHRPNGYVSFMYDLTPYLKDGENTLTVRVDHSREADSRWYTGSGIYRDVYLVKSGKTHFSLWGVDYKLLSINDKQATVEVNAKIDNPSNGLRVVAALYDENGVKVATASAPVKGEAARVLLKVKNPHRWDIIDPYLYKLDVQLCQGKSVIDSDVETVGLRTLEFDPNTGFALNGRNIKAKGVCLHHDAGVLGAAVPKAVWKRRLANLKKLGVNAIRMSHNPQSPDVYDLCDELGLLVIDEVSDEWEYPKRKWLTGWNNGTPGFQGSYDFFEEWIDRDIADMVRRDRNHPCIFLWSIGNEVDYPNDPYSHPILDKGGDEFSQPIFGGYNPNAPRAERIGEIAKRLTAIVKDIDTSRPVTGALAGVVMSNQTEYPFVVDVCGYNYTESQYPIDHQAYPDRIIFGSETSVRHDSWKAVRDNDYIFGQFLWTGTDYLGESRKWPSRGFGTGLLDLASLPKPRGQFRASLWLDEPFTYIGAYPTPNRQNRQHRPGVDDPAKPFLTIEAPDAWNYEDGQLMTVVCYTNAPYAKLLLNGEEVGEMKPYDDETGIIYWQIAYQPGVLEGIGCDADGNALSSYATETTGLPYAIRASIDGEYDPAPGAVNHVLVEIVDQEGRLVKLADNMIACKVQDGTLLGLENGDNQDLTMYTSQKRRAYHGRLLAIVRNAENGRLNLTFTSPLLQKYQFSAQ